MPVWMGLDVSGANGAIDWPRVQADGIQFAVIRSSYGVNGVDVRWQENQAGARAAGLPVGAYHYSYALTEAEAAQEAAHVLSLVRGVPLTLPVWYDMEDADGWKAAHGFDFSRAHITALCRVFERVLRAAGVACGVYASESWWNSYINAAVLTGDKWVAAWRDTPPARAFDLWQYTDSGAVGGITGAVDLDRCEKNYFGEDAGMIIYPTYEDTPDWAKPTVRKLVHLGYLKGEDGGILNLEYNALRNLVINDRAGLYDA